MALRAVATVLCTLGTLTGYELPGLGIGPIIYID